MIAVENRNEDTPRPPLAPFGPIEKVDLASYTRNRAKLLEKTIASLKRLIVPYQVGLRVITLWTTDRPRTKKVSAKLLIISK